MGKMEWYGFMGEPNKMGLDTAGKACEEALTPVAIAWRVESGAWRWEVCAPAVNRPKVWGMEPTKFDAMNAAEDAYQKLIKADAILKPPYLDI